MISGEAKVLGEIATLEGLLAFDGELRGVWDEVSHHFAQYLDFRDLGFGGRLAFNARLLLKFS